MSDKKKFIVIGGGAAGFFCAVNTARMNPALEVVIIEKTNKLLSKVSVSGGGRCNLTHACFDILEMSKKYPRGGSFVKKTFHHFFTMDTINWFEERGVKLKTEADGRMFPVTNSSQTVINCLLNEAQLHKVDIQMKTEVKAVRYVMNQFRLEIINGSELTCDYLCIATGGYPKSLMFQWLTKLEHSFEEPVPSLFTFNLHSGNAGQSKHPITKLMGVSVANASVKIVGTKLLQGGSLLITHWGLSGPAVLKLSAWGARELAQKNYDFNILVNWLSEFNEQQLAEKLQTIRFDIASQKIYNKNPFGLPQRLWEFIVDASGIKIEMRWADLPAKEQNKLIKNLCAFEFNVKGKTTFKEEFVTAGGIKLNEIDHNTMMSKKTPNLFFAGEVMDVDGVTGGFNFQHAWTSGFVSAKHIAAISV